MRRLLIFTGVILFSIGCFIVSKDIRSKAVTSESASAEKAIGSGQQNKNITKPLLSSPGQMASKQTSASPAPLHSNAIANAQSPTTEPVRKRVWDENYLQTLGTQSQGDAIHFELLNGVQAEGTIQFIRRQGGDVTYVTGQLTSPEQGRFFFQKQSLPGNAGSFVGVVEFPASKTAYRLEPTGANGSAELVEHPLDKVICMYLPLPTADATNTAEIPPLNPSTFPSNLPIPPYQNGIVTLQSMPGAKAVIYLDFQGGYTPTWGGIKYEKPSVSNAQIYDVWKRVAERYEPFQVNVTTDMGVFSNAVAVSRQRCLITPTSTAAPGAGGVSYIGSFQWGGSPDTPNWVFMTSGKACAEAIAHECGHALGLGHDGQDVDGNHTEYYGGQGSGATGWAPIMGVGYYQQVVQWCKGEYQNANNTQDDLAIISANNNMSYRVDDTGDTLATSRYLEINSNNIATAEGVIETAGDTDAFQFTTRGGSINLKTSPVGDWGGLAIRASIKNANDEEIASNNPQTLDTATIATNLPAGTYTYCVTGAGRNDPYTDGFSDYASLGYYSISGTVSNGRLPNRFTLAENSPNGTVLGTIQPVAGSVGHSLTYIVTKGNEQGTFALDANGQLTVADNTLLDYEALAANTQLAIQIELFVDITDLTDGSLSETSRRVVISITNVNEAPEAIGFTNSIMEHSQVGTIVGAVTGSDPDYFTVLSYSITGGNTDSKFKINSQTGLITVNGDLSVTNQSVYTLEVTVSDQNTTKPLTGKTTVKVNILTNNTPYTPGSISYAMYTNISGNLINNLTGSSTFPYNPATEVQLTQAEAPNNQTDNYGAVMRGYVIPPVTGIYYFYIASDDNSVLYLSPNTNAASMIQRANITGDGSCTSPEEFTKYASQKSAAILLTAGQAYYLEARMKEGGGDDNFSVAWSSAAAGIDEPTVIPGKYLAPFFMNYTPRVAGFTNSLHRDAFLKARVGTVTKTDVNSTDQHSFTITSGNVYSAFEINATNGIIRVANQDAIASGSQSTYTLSIRVTDNGTPARSAVTTATIKLVATNAITTTAIYQEIWNNIGNSTAVTALTGNSAYPKRPDTLRPLTQFSSGSANYADNYGSRIRVWLTPPTTGAYIFFLSSDDNGMLKFSATTNPATASTIARVSDSSSYQNWTAFTSQKSVTLNLTAGQKYYLETLQKEGGGDDHVEVAWVRPGVTGTNIIDDAYLTSEDLGFAPVMSPKSAYVTPLFTNGTVVSTMVAQSSSLENVTFRISGGNLNNTFAIDPDKGTVTIADNSLIQSRQVSSFPLTIEAQSSGYGDLFPRKSTIATLNITIIEATAASWIGAGADDSWSTSDNWGGNLLQPNVPVTFSGTTRQTNINNTLSLAGPVTFVNGGFYISGNALTLAAGINNTGSNTWAIDSTLNRNETLWSQYGNLVMAGTMDLGSYLLTIQSDDQIEVQKPLIGTGSVIKTGAGTATLESASTFSGPLTVAAGTLALKGGTVAASTQISITNGATLDSSTQPLVVPSTQTLTGSGTVLGSTTINGILAAGDSIGTMVFSNALNLAGTTQIELSKDSSGTLAGDKVKVTGPLTYGGSLVVTTSGSDLAAGDAFDLFDATTFNGSFTATTLPTLGNGLTWNTSWLTVDGTLRVEKASSLQIKQVQMKNGQLSLQIQSASGVNYVLESTPSLNTPIKWTPVSTNSGIGGVLTIETTASATQQFYRISTP